MPLKMSTESPKRLSFLLTPSTKPPSVYTEPSWAGRGEFRGALAGGPLEEESPPAGSGFPEVPPRQLQGRAHLHLGLRPLPLAHITGGAGSIPIPPHLYPQGVLLPESQRGLVQAMCLHSGKHSKKAGTGVLASCPVLWLSIELWLDTFRWVHCDPKQQGSSEKLLGRQPVVPVTAGL